MEELSIKKNNPDNVVEENSTQVFKQKEKDNSTEYFSERAKKLTTAIYVVTNFIPQADPLRLFMRKLSVRLLSLIGASLAENASIQTVSNSDPTILCKKITEMLEISFFSGYVSEMNFSVLKTEFDLFANEISDYDGSAALKINRNFLKVRAAPSKMSFNDANPSKGQNPDISIGPRRHGEVTPHPKGLVGAKKVSRKEAIISIIKMKGAVSIKDISSVVINCSEKTIQRELMSLVVNGTLKRTGERRWSVYSIAA